LHFRFSDFDCLLLGNHTLGIVKRVAGIPVSVVKNLGCASIGNAATRGVSFSVAISPRSTPRFRISVITLALRSCTSAKSEWLVLVKKLCNQAKNYFWTHFVHHF
jgi:hypothetical protein